MEDTSRVIYQSYDGYIKVTRDSNTNTNTVDISGSNVNTYSDGSKMVHTPNGAVFIGKDSSGNTLIRTSTQAIKISASGSVSCQHLTSEQRGEFHDVNPPELELPVTGFLDKSDLALWLSFFSANSLHLERKFEESSLYRHALRRLNDVHLLTITGWPGDGMTWTGKKLLSYFTLSGEDVPKYGENNQKEIYMRYHLMDSDREARNFAVINSVDDWHRKIDLSQNQVILIDNIFGEGALDLHLVKLWKPILKNMHTLISRQNGKTMVILCLPKTHYKEMPAYLKTWPVFKIDNMLDLSDPLDDYSFTQRVMKSYSYMPTEEIKSLFVMTPKGYGFLSMMYGSCKLFKMEGRNFFNNPDSAITTVLNKLYEFNQIIYFTLAMAVMFEGKLSLDKSDLSEFSEHEQELVKMMIEPLKVPPIFTLGQLRFAAEKLNGIFFRCTGKHCWRFVHDRLFVIIAKDLFTRIPSLMLQHVSGDFFFSRFYKTGYSDSLEGRINLTSNYTEFYQRLTYESLSGKMDRVCTFMALQDEHISNGWVKFMSEMGSLLTVIQQRTEFSRSMCFWSAFYGYPGLMAAFLESPDLEDIRKEGWFQEELQCCMLAACCGNSDKHARVISLLIQKKVALEPYEILNDADFEELYGDDVLILRKLKAPLLHYAAIRGNADMVLALGPHVNLEEKSADGYTAVHRAACNTDIDVMEHLLSMKAKPNEEAHNGRLPWQLALLTGNIPCYELLLNRGIMSGQDPCFDGSSQLYFLLKSCNYSDLKGLIEKNKMPPDGNVGSEMLTPLMVAIALNLTDTVDVLIEKGADVNKNVNGLSPLHVAILSYNIPLLKLLLDKKADVNYQGYQKKTPLFLAAELGMVDIVDILIKNGAKPEIRNAKGELPINSAAKNGFIRTTQYLIREGVIMNEEKLKNFGFSN